MREKVNKMLLYLGLETYQIPNWGLKFPDELDEFYRPDRKFTYIKKTGTITYEGTDESFFGHVRREPVKLEGIYPPDDFIAKLYGLLETNCLEKAKKAVLSDLLFNRLTEDKLEFLNLNKANL